MKKLLLWLIPPAGFVCGWIMGTDHSDPSPPLISPSMKAPVRDIKVLPTSQENRHQSASSTPQLKPVPLVTLREAVSYPSEIHQLGALLRILDTEVTPEQFASLHAELLSLDPPPSDNLLKFFFRHWARTAPEAAVEAAIADWENGKAVGFYCALAGWAERDALAALTYARKLKTKYDFNLSTLEELAYPKPGDLPPKDALRRIHEIHGGGEPSSSLLNAAGAIFREWAKTDPEAAWREALSLPSGGGESRLRVWTLGRVIEAQVPTDPTGAAKLIESLPAGPERVQLEADYVGLLAWGKNRHLAKAYALAMPDGPERRKVISSLASTLLRVDKEGVGALISSLPASDLQDPTVFFNFFHDWMRTEPQRASEVLLAHIPANIQPTPEQQEAYDNMFIWWYGSEPHAASEFLLKLPESIRGKTLEKAIGTFCYQNPSEAKKWAAALPTGPDRDKIMQYVGENMAGFGVNGITDWLNQLPPDSGKFAAIEGFTSKIVSISPDDALTWIRTEPNQGSRLERLKRVWNSWNDRDAAQRWRDTSAELSDAERAALR